MQHPLPCRRTPRGHHETTHASHRDAARARSWPDSFAASSAASAPCRSAAGHRLSSLALREIEQVTSGDIPRLYGTTPDARYLPWGHGTEASYERACSKKSRGRDARYRAVDGDAYHETGTPTDPRLQLQYRQLMQLLRGMKEVQAMPDAIENWMPPSRSSQAA